MKWIVDFESRLQDTIDAVQESVELAFGTVDQAILQAAEKISGSPPPLGDFKLPPSYVQRAPDMSHTNQRQQVKLPDWPAKARVKWRLSWLYLHLKDRIADINLNFINLFAWKEDAETRLKELKKSRDALRTRLFVAEQSIDALGEQLEYQQRQIRALTNKLEV